MTAGTEVPPWSVRAVAVAVVAGSVAAPVLAWLSVGLVDTIAPGVTRAPLALAAAIAIAAAYLAATLLVAARTEPTEPAQFGLRRVPAAVGVAWAALAAAPCLALLALALAIDDGEAAIKVVPELAAEPASAAAAGPATSPVPFDAAVLASALGRAVIPAVATALVACGFALPALARRLGTGPAVAVAGLLCVAPFGPLLGDAGGSLYVPALGLAVAVAALRVATGSLYPGVAMLGAGLAIALAGGLAWSPPGAAALGLACAAGAFAFAAALAAVWPSPRSTGRAPLRGFSRGRPSW